MAFELRSDHINVHGDPVLRDADLLERIVQDLHGSQLLRQCVAFMTLSFEAITSISPHITASKMSHNL
jgi:hypothetical protein